MSLLRVTLLAALSIATTGCVKLTIAWADLKPKGDAAAPTILGKFGNAGSVTSIAAWQTDRAPILRQALEEHVYGYFPDNAETTIVSRKVLDENAFGDLGYLEEYELTASSFYGDQSNTSNTFYMNVLRPKASTTPTPVILMQTFCPRADTIPHPGIEGAGNGGCGGTGFMNNVMTYIFGRYISTPPLEAILSEGYAIATIFPGEMVADRPVEGLEDLRSLSEGHADDETRWGAIAAWGWAFSRMVDVLEQDPAIATDAMVTYGHSRYGKAALVAAAYDKRIDGVIAHQSGTGGASLNVRKKGESVSDITQSYPHWFSRKYAGFAGKEEQMPVDQHMLIALTAPRPILLGNARRDVWSDPNGAFKAAIGADPVYELYGKRGLDQEKLKPFDPTADISFWIRPGTHGVVEEDWPAFLEFLNAHFKDQAQ